MRVMACRVTTRTTRTHAEAQIADFSVGLWSVVGARRLLRVREGARKAVLLGYGRTTGR
jgi:hypothetical protein